VRIAQVSPLIESVPPHLYGGTERVVHYITEELVRMGHEVTLFASGDSMTTARLNAVVPTALRLAGVKDTVSPHVLMLEQVLSLADTFDIIHFHTDFWHFPFSRRLRTPTVTTAHGRLDLPELAPLFLEFTELPMISISDNQRAPLPFANWVGTVRHGLPPALLPFCPQPAANPPYFAFTGRISPEKRPDLAIEIARRVGIELRIAAKVDSADRDYFEQKIRPLLGQPGITFIGEICDRRKPEFLGNALALLFPIDWPEPFGLVMIEAMSCGTPVIATRRGSVPEVIDHGLSGFIVDSVDEAVAAARAIAHGRGPSRRTVRQTFDNRFTARRMADDYLAAYRRLCDARIAGRAEHPRFHASRLPGAVEVALGTEHGRNR
jgi:glycosyltransferase involved in cell wall biosynthesis